jgi:epoxide hydrolase-like predicted phosphatase
MIKAVIFDVGGTLHTPTEKDVKKDICQTMGVTEKQYTTACNTLIPAYNTGEIVDEKEFWKRFIVFTKSKAAIPDYSLWSREFSNKYQVQIEVMKIVSNLKQQGLKLAILSNTIEPHAKVDREKGVYSPFKIVILSNEVGIRKPDPKIYKITLNKLGVKAEDAVFVDDSDVNVQAAIALGIHGIVFKNSDQLKTDLTIIGVKLTN